jgi:pimeloyl-ACP methyl ester carboxylesterase
MRTYERAGLTFDVRDSGSGQRGTVLALHGFPQDGSAYDDAGARLVAAGLRVLAPDQRGYSPGARPTGSRADYAMTELVADAVASARTWSATTGAARSPGCSPGGTRIGSRR